MNSDPFERFFKRIKEEIEFIDKEIEEIENSPQALLFNKVFDCYVINKGSIVGKMVVFTKECRLRDLIYGMRLYCKSIELIDYYLQNPLRIKGLLRAINILTSDYIFIAFSKVPFILDDNFRLQYVIDKETNLTVLKKSIYNQPLLVRNQSTDAYNMITNPKLFFDKNTLKINKGGKKVEVKSTYLVLDSYKLIDENSNEIISSSPSEDHIFYSL